MTFAISAVQKNFYEGREKCSDRLPPQILLANPIINVKLWLFVFQVFAESTIATIKIRKGVNGDKIPNTWLLNDIILKLWKILSL